MGVTRMMMGPRIPKAGDPVDYAWLIYGQKLADGQTVVMHVPKFRPDTLEVDADVVDPVREVYLADSGRVYEPPADVRLTLTGQPIVDYTGRSHPCAYTVAHGAEFKDLLRGLLEQWNPDAPPVPLGPPPPADASEWWDRDLAASIPRQRFREFDEYEYEADDDYPEF